MINYQILNESTLHYTKLGYRRIEVPWTVSEYIDNITKPSDRISFQLKHNNKCLVASGEQSFLYLYLKEFLPKGKYMAITPCFRNESFDFLHSKYFMKNELIRTDVVNSIVLHQMVSNAKSFFDIYLPKDKVVIKTTDIGYDIMIDEIELGSYGIRECEFLKWIYGTGCAEPRLSKIIELYGVS